MEIDGQSAFQWVASGIGGLFLLMTGKGWIRHDKLKEELIRKYSTTDDVKESLDKLETTMRRNHTEVMNKLDTKVDK